MQRVCFLCTGNYYRSRFAQAVFNHEAQERELAAVSFSRGLALNPLINRGLLSPHTTRALEAKGWPLSLAGAMPKSLELSDLEQADHVVAIKKTEHYPLMQAQFPDWADRIEYWEIHDLDHYTPEEALPRIESRVLDLLARLQGTS